MDPPSSTTASSPTQHQRSQSLQQAVVPPSGPQIRSRITVVCAECKRLKLKCDRKTPCGSCEKRDTVARCIYSPAAAEKVDLHSLNNRLSAVETQLTQMGSAGARSYNHNSASGSGLPSNDRALIAVGHSGSSLTIPLEDITAIWLDQLDLNKDLLPTGTHSNPSLSPTLAPYSPSQIKLEPNTTPINAINTASDLPAALLIPSPSIYFSVKPRSSQPSVSSELINLLPSLSTKRRKLCNSVEEILTINPCFNWKHFRERMDSMFRWAANSEAIERAAMESGGSSPRSASRADFARAIFFGEPTRHDVQEPKPTVSFFAAVAGALAVGAQASRDQNGNGANEDYAMVVDDILSNGRPPSRRAPSSVSSANGKKFKTTVNKSPLPPNMDNRSTVSPAMLFALSEQALDIFEKSGTYDLDFLVALIMQALYMLHDGKPVVDHRLYPLVGKMVNVARMMGLSMDPDEFPGRYSLFEAETRRRIWWDIYCYDLYVSDSMGHPPTIPDNSFTTKMPVDIDENLFSPSSTTIPLASIDDHTSKYFGLKVRMAQIVKSVKKRTFRDPLTDSPMSESAMIEEAASFEGEVTHFLLDLPPAFKLDIDTDLSALCGSSSPPSLFLASSPGRSSPSACLIAQQCELVITGQRLILKIYLPFLRPNHSGSTCNATHNQAALGTINAAHAIIFASRVLHALCKRPPGAQSKRLGPAIFDYYSFGQALFDAAVVCAHSVIMQPTAIWAKVALDDVLGALEVMKDPAVATGRSSIQSGVECGASEPVKIIEMLKIKADNARAGNATSFGGNSGSKRKHNEVGTGSDRLVSGFQLPYVGAAVASAGPAIASPSSSAQVTSSPDAMHSDSGLHHNNLEGGSAKRSDSGQAKSRKDKKHPYPMVGIRVRPGREVPLMRRERAHSTTSTSSFVENDARMPAPGSGSFTSSQSISHVPTSASSSRHSFSMPSTEPSVYQPSPSTESMQRSMQPELMSDSHTDYSGSYANPENGSLNMNVPQSSKYATHDAGPQQGYSTGTPNQIPMFDRSQSNSFTSTATLASFRPDSSSQPSNGLSFDGGPGIPSPIPPMPFAHSHESSTQPYNPPLPHSSSGYLAPPPYNFDNGSQGCSLSLNLPSSMSMDNTHDMNGPIHTSSSDMVFGTKSQDGNVPQQSFGNSQGQGQQWQGNNGSEQYWQNNYKTYYPT